MKYLMIDGVFPVLFPNDIEHKDVMVYLRRNGSVIGKVTSAGFVKWANGKAYTFGNSFSLGIGPNQMDAEIIKDMMKAE